MSEEQHTDHTEKKEKEYVDDIFIHHKFCRSCINFARPSLPILSSWGKCTKGKVKNWCRDYYPACELYQEKTHNQETFEKVMFSLVIILIVIVLIKFVVIFGYLLSHPNLQIPADQQRHWRGQFGQLSE